MAILSTRTISDYRVITLRTSASTRPPANDCDFLVTKCSLALAGRSVPLCPAPSTHLTNRLSLPNTLYVFRVTRRRRRRRHRLFLVACRSAAPDVSESQTESSVQTGR